MRKLYPVSVSCGVLEVSASGYFNWLRRRESGHGGPARRHSDEALLAYMVSEASRPLLPGRGEQVSMCPYARQWTYP